MSVPKIPENCFTCEHWNVEKHRCDRVLKGSVRLGMEGGQLTGVMVFETTRGLLTADLEADLSEFLVESIPALIESWPHWDKVFKLHDGKHCGAEQSSKCLKAGLRVLPSKTPESDQVTAKQDPGYMKNPGWSGF